MSLQNYNGAERELEANGPSRSPEYIQIKLPEKAHIEM